MARVITGIRSLIRTRLTAHVPYFVDPAGTDAPGFGLSTGAAAFRTIQYAVNWLVYKVDQAGFTASITIGDGTYAEDVNFLGATLGQTQIGIAGASGHAASVIINGSFYAKDLGIMSLNNMTINAGATNFAVCAQQFAVLDLGAGVILGAAASKVLIKAIQAGSINALGAFTIAGGAIYAIACQQGGQFWNPSFTINVTGTPAFSGAFLYADAGSIVQPGTFTGSATGKRFDIAPGGNLLVGGDPDTIIPGNAAGTIALGGTSNYGAVAPTAGYVPVADGGKFVSVPP